MAKLRHQELMEEHGIEIDSLPMNIKKKINALKPTTARYNKNNTPKLREAIIKQDIDIAELIADFIEKDLPDANEEVELTQAELDKKAEEAAKNELDAKIKLEEEKAKEEAAKKQPITTFGTIQMENEITDECNKNNGYISQEKLSAIIGKTVWGLNHTEAVYSIKVVKVYAKPIYKLQ